MRVASHGPRMEMRRRPFSTILLAGWLLVWPPQQMPGGHAKLVFRDNVQIPDEQQILELLLTDYERISRPVNHHARPVTVDFRLKFRQLVGLDEKYQMLTTNVYIEQIWRDENLAWNSEDYSGLSRIRLASSSVWIPDIVLMNNADDEINALNSPFVLVDSNGLVRLPLPVKLRSTCKVNIAHFPFDRQHCYLQFGTLSMSSVHMRLRINATTAGASLDLANHTDNSDWTLQHVYLKMAGRKYGKWSCAHHHAEDAQATDICLVVVIDRRGFFYVWSILMPCVILTLISMLTFLTPAVTGEKISLGLSVFLNLSMFLLIIAEKVPPTDGHMPLIALFLVSVMTITAMSVIFSAIVINLHSKDMQIPVWLIKLIFSSPVLYLVNISRPDCDLIFKREKILKRFESKLSGLTQQVISMFNWAKSIEYLTKLLDCLVVGRERSVASQPAESHDLQSSSTSLLTNIDKLNSIICANTNYKDNENNLLCVIKNDLRRASISMTNAGESHADLNLSKHSIPSVLSSSSSASSTSSSSSSSSSPSKSSMNSKSKSLKNSSSLIAMALPRIQKPAVIAKNPTNRGKISRRKSDEDLKDTAWSETWQQRAPKVLQQLVMSQTHAKKTKPAKKKPNSVRLIEWQILSMVVERIFFALMVAVSLGICIALISHLNYSA